MADNASFMQLSESIQHLSFLQELPDTPEDEKEALHAHLQDLVSRQESKFNNIIAMLKRCDHFIETLEAEMDEIKAARDAWKKNKDNLVNIIKFAYQQNLIDKTLTGNKYQATIKKSKARLVDNFQEWDDDQIKEYGLIRTTTITRIKDDSIIEVKEEKLADKERLRQDITEEKQNVPPVAQLVPGLAFTYKRRTRLTT